MICEEVFFCCWEINFSGCFLYVLDLIILCLKLRFFLNYFMFENNFIDCFEEEDINVFCILIEYVCFFLFNVI